MNKPSRPENTPVPDDWTLSDAEEQRLTLDRLAAFDTSGLGHTPGDLKAWAQARKTDPAAPWPPARKLR